MDEFTTTTCLVVLAASALILLRILGESRRRAVADHRTRLEARRRERERRAEGDVVPIVSGETI